MISFYMHNIIGQITILVLLICYHLISNDGPKGALNSNIRVNFFEGHNDIERILHHYDWQRSAKIGQDLPLNCQSSVKKQC